MAIQYIPMHSIYILLAPILKANWCLHPCSMEQHNYIYLDMYLLCYTGSDIIKTYLLQPCCCFLLLRSFYIKMTHQKTPLSPIHDPSRTGEVSSCIQAVFVGGGATSAAATGATFATGGAAFFFSGLGGSFSRAFSRSSITVFFEVGLNLPVIRTIFSNLEMNEVMNE